MKDTNMYAFSLAFLLLILAFTIYYAVISSKFFKSWASRVFGGEDRAPSIYLQRLLGVVCFAAIPFAVFKVTFPRWVEFDYFGSIGKPSIVYWLSSLCLLVLVLMLIVSKRKSHLQEYPQISNNKWSVFTVVFSALTWIAYLVAYEWLFRGLFFFISLEIMAPWLAILINTIVYALAHIPKGRTEIIGSIPLGIVLCIATWHTGSIWVPVITHITLALSNEWLSLFRHPKIKLEIW